MRSALTGFAASLMAVPMLAALPALAQPAALQPSRPIGYQQAAVPDPGHRPIAVDIWYPTDAEPATIQAGPLTVKGTAGAPVAGNALPMIVISHGTGAASISHLDTVVALAEAGFVVVAPTHNGDNFRDDSAVGKPEWFADRSRHVVRAIEYMRREWKDAARLGDKTGLFGFSAGATTALIAAGGVPDMGRIAPHCAAKPEFVCQILQPVQTRPTWSHAPGIGALVLAAPGIGFAFDSAGLAAVRMPVQLWSGTEDRTVPFETNAGAIGKSLPAPADLHQVNGAGHLSFLMPCGALVIPQICEDPEGFDRAAFHAQFNRTMIEFFRARL